MMQRQRKNNYQTGGEIPVLRWSNRRRMAWWAFAVLTGGTFLYWFGLPLWFTFFGLSIEWLSIIGTSYSWFASTMAIVITAYMGINSSSVLRSPIAPPETNSPIIEDEDEYYDPS